MIDSVIYALSCVRNLKSMSFSKMKINNNIICVCMYTYVIVMSCPNNLTEQFGGNDKLVAGSNSIQDESIVRDTGRF